MATLRLKIDLSGTVGNLAWEATRQFDMAQSAEFGPQFGMGGPCLHSSLEAHRKGEWWGAEVQIPNSLVAQYALAHYLEQDRVLDAEIE